MNLLKGRLRFKYISPVSTLSKAVGKAVMLDS
uniref:Uncharacterized protein n=1 Tax=Anguilla anguilla TaxID=7936 RepID=A0A0E9S524_ANGAN